MQLKRKGRLATRPWAVQFRLTTELGQVVKDFAAAHSLSVPEACRRLVTLAVSGMDARFYPLISKLAVAMGGDTAFFQACGHIKTALQVAGRLRPELLQDDQQRAKYIGDTAREHLKAKGLDLGSEGPWGW
jgi:hypothetical protein